tara:strand:- start:7182 stop:8396 length:1215 start_codon:yes stop_codon:yes gene_type:complete
MVISLDQAAFVRPLAQCVLGHDALEPFLDLGDHFLVDFLTAPDPAYPKASLNLLRCGECGMLQLYHVVSRERLFRQYWYKSGVNSTMVDHLQRLATEFDLKNGDTVVDIGANDGTLLSFFSPNVTKVGFEPGLNLQTELAQHADVVVPDFFTPDGVPKKADLVLSLAMFYDLTDPQRFAADIAAILAPKGTWVCEMNYLGDMVERNAFDFILHEHVALYFLSTFNKVVRPVGLEVVGVNRNTINGGSVRYYVAHRGAFTTSTSVDELLGHEKPLRDPASLERFAKSVTRISQTLKGWVNEARSQGKTVYGYGASTRGMTVLQAAGLDATNIAAVADKNPDKVGRVMAGVDIPIVSEAAFRAAQPDYAIMLPWGFKDEFVKREQEYLRAGGRFIVPLPEPEVIGG